MTRQHARLDRLEHRHKASAPGPHDSCLALLNARSWAGQPAVLECFLGDPADCPHRTWVEYCQNRDAQADELYYLVGLEEAQTSGPDITAEEAERQAEGVARLTAMMTVNLPKLEAQLALTKGRQP